MIELLVEILQWALILGGSFFLVVGAFGVARMPDVFTRMHAASVSDTLGAGLLIIGMCLESGFSLVTVKLLVILILFFFTSPLATHALSRAALVVGVKPLLVNEDGTLESRIVETSGSPQDGTLWPSETLEEAEPGVGSREGREAAMQELNEQDITSGDAGAIEADKEEDERK